MSRLSVVLRIARRDARRAKGRSALVVAMIALPVLGVGAADVLYRSFELSPAQKATRILGTADALLSDSGQSSIRQLPGLAGSGYAGYDGSGAAGRTGPRPAVSTVLPTGSRVLPLSGTGARVFAPDGLASTDVEALDVPLDDPLTQGMYARRTGRVPRGPDEVVLSRSLADRFGVGLGDRLGVAVDPFVARGTDGAGATRGPSRPRTIVGLVDRPDATNSRFVVVASGSLADREPFSWLVDVPGQLTWQDVEVANGAGFQLLPKADVLGQPPLPREVAELTGTVLTAVTLVVGMALLEVVLLAGPAFAVGVKRQTRELALLSASGAERREVRRTVLAGGAVLGVVGAVVGVVAGTGLALAGLPYAERLTSTLPGPFELRPLDLGAIVAVGVGTALLAALLPARAAARLDVVAALTGRRGTVRSRRSTPVLGLLAAAAGAALALEGARRRDVNTILAGSAVAELGLVATTPFLVGLVSRLGSSLPLGPRLALRDAARNRGRTAPAVSAILAAVAGSVAVATYFASTDRYERDQYVAQAPAGAVRVYLGGRLETAAQQAAFALRQALPDHRVETVTAVGGGPLDTTFASVAPACGLQGDDQVLRFAGPLAAEEPGCRSSTYRNAAFGEMLVGDAALVGRLTGLPEDELDDVAAVLSRGGVVVAARSVRSDGQAGIVIEHPAVQGPPRQELVLLPAVAVTAGDLDATVVSPAAARRLGIPLHETGVLGTADHAPTAQQQDRAQAALAQLGLDGTMIIERGYVSSYGLPLLALLLGSAVIVLGASGIATGLAAADGRADLSTLAAVGASPRTRRTLAAFQSAVTAGLGTVLGALAGVVPAIAMLRALNNSAVLPGTAPLPHPIVLPWTNLLVTLVLVPLLAALAAALLTRSRLPMVRRLA